MRFMSVLSILFGAAWNLASTGCCSYDGDAPTRAIEFVVGDRWDRETEKYDFTIYGLSELPASVQPAARRLQAEARSTRWASVRTSSDGRAIVSCQPSDQQHELVLIPDWMHPEQRIEMRGRDATFLAADKLLLIANQGRMIYDLRSGVTVKYPALRSSASADYPIQESGLAAMTSDGWLAAVDDLSDKVIVVSDVMSGTPRREFEAPAAPGHRAFWLQAGQWLVVSDTGGHTVVYDRKGSERMRVEGRAGGAVGDDAFIVHKRGDRSVIYRCVSDAVEVIGTLDEGAGVMSSSPSGAVIELQRTSFVWGTQWTLTRSGVDRNCDLPPEGGRSKSAPVWWLRFDPHSAASDDARK